MSCAARRCHRGDDGALARGCDHVRDGGHGHATGISDRYARYLAAYADPG